MYASNVIGLDALTNSTPGHSLRAVAWARRSSYGLLTSSAEETGTPFAASSSREKRVLTWTSCSGRCLCPC